MKERQKERQRGEKERKEIKRKKRSGLTQNDALPCLDSTFTELNSQLKITMNPVVIKGNNESKIKATVCKKVRN